MGVSTHVFKFVLGNIGMLHDYCAELAVYSIAIRGDTNGGVRTEARHHLPT